MEYKVYANNHHDKDKRHAHAGDFRHADSAGDFYSFIEEACDNTLDIATRTAFLRNAYRRAIEQKTASCSIAFAGIFSKLDYCIKEAHVPYTVATLLNRARKDLFTGHGSAAVPTADRMEADFPHDLKATALLVYHLYGKVEIPETIKRHFPAADRKETWGKFSRKSVRAVVTRWDSEHIWADEAENGTSIKVCYGKGNRILTADGKFSWEYLGSALWTGAQINLVRMRESDDGEVYFPELIILEPDFLVNITTVAGCFQLYAESPFANLIAKLRPQPDTMAVHLGNFAGQLLDDTVHGSHVTFEESLAAFIRDNALNLIACREFIEGYGTFKEEARLQERNIRKIIGENLYSDIDGYDSSNVRLEPSFISETLGIQGRMDFLYTQHDGQEDRYVIIEQKSGKGDFVPYSSPGYSPDIPKPREQHQVQLLLYRALFQYEFSKYAGQLSNFMLYSRYAKGLVATPQNPSLLLRAVRMRNLIVWSEILYAKEGMYMLKTLTPEKLNMKQIGGRLWEEHIRPQLAAVLAPIHEASELELAYYLRFMRFIENETLLAKVGNKTKESSGFASIWHDSLEEKKAAGNIYDRLTIDGYGEDSEGVSSISLSFGDDASADTTNFRQGDIVLLYYYDPQKQPDACAQMVFRATIEDIREKGITLRLRNSQTDKRVFEKHREGCLWAIEHDMFDSSSGSLYRGMHSFLSTAKRRRDLILLQREPEVDTSVSIKGSYGSFDTLVTRAKQAQDLFLIIGPPGTGKTSFGLVNILKEELLKPDTCVLLLSYTNRAVDEICSKLVEIRDEDPGFDFIRIGSDLSCSKEYRRFLLKTISGDEGMTANAIRKKILNTRVFCGTTAALSASLALFRLKRFSLAVVDEASQILEPHLMAILSAMKDGSEAIGKFVLIGDHKQLPAVVQQTQEESAVTENELNAIHLTDCRNSLFERLLKQFKTTEGYDPRFVYMLTRQGRMHKDIAEFPNYAFYGNKLDVVPLDHQLLPDTATDSSNGIVRLLSSHRIAFVASGRPKPSASAKTNGVEAEMIAATVYQIYLTSGDGFDRERTVGVIVPYRNQISTIRSLIDRHGIPCLHHITIDTVERYQGSQRDVIIYSFTAKRKYQLQFLTSNEYVDERDGAVIDRKLNVAMTRARKHLLLVGNAALLGHDVTFRRLIGYTQEQGTYRDCTEQDLMQTTPTSD